VRNIGTWALVGAVAVLGLAALVDAVMGRGEPAAEQTRTRPHERTTAVDERAQLTDTLERRGIGGAITYADTQCGLHVVSLPALDTAGTGDAPSCAFTVSPANTWTPEDGVAVDPRTRSDARCLRAGVVELHDASDGRIHTGPGCSPAWTPDGRLTSVWKGALYLLEVRRRDAIGLDPVPLLTRAQLARELAATPWGRNAPFVRQAAWLDDDLVAVIVAGDGGVGDGIALFRNGRLVGFPLGPYGPLARLRPSPHGTYVSAVIADGTGVVVADAGGSLVAIPIRSGQAIAWSPDELFGLIASPGGTTLFEPPTADHAVTQVVGLPIVARDLVWN
jgi:hypothetical protein